MPILSSFANKSKHTATPNSTPTPTLALTIESGGVNRGLRLSRFIVEDVDTVFYYWVRNIINVGGIVERFGECRSNDYRKYTFNQTSYTIYI